MCVYYPVGTLNYRLSEVALATNCCKLRSKKNTIIHVFCIFTFAYYEKIQQQYFTVHNNAEKKIK